MSASSRAPLDTAHTALRGMRRTANRFKKHSDTHLHARAQHFAQEQVVDECHAILCGPICTAMQWPNQRWIWFQHGAGGREQVQATMVVNSAEPSSSMLTRCTRGCPRAQTPALLGPHWSFWAAPCRHSACCRIPSSSRNSTEPASDPELLAETAGSRHAALCCRLAGACAGAEVVGTPEKRS